ncbi:integrase core domain-containing protein [Thalassobacterium sedimentorum]|uniref:integrase core domain-containing protein n=1 Tax=Thalassobacterium sedimentorum TaxID=3041258 RepID=UPI003CE572BF
MSCDHDPLYTKEFRQILTDSEVEVIQTRVGCPQQNGYAESFVSAIKRECIDHMIFFSEKSLRRAVEQYIDHFTTSVPRSAVAGDQLPRDR